MCPQLSGLNLKIEEEENCWKREEIRRKISLTTGSIE